MNYQFIDFLIQQQALMFGEFSLKSGRLAPYFFNLGRLNSGVELKRLGEFYAEAIVKNWSDQFEIVFGPAYKGIPLSVSIVLALYSQHGLNKRYASNRKEAKTYADKSV